MRTNHFILYTSLKSSKSFCYSIKNICFFILLILFSNNSIAQLKKNESKKSFFKTLIGTSPKNSITLLPFGTHTKHPDLFGVYYLAFNYKSLQIASFKNSFGDLTTLLTYEREIVLTNHFSVEYGAGVMYGYNGKLQNVKGIPFRKTFLFTGSINPIIGIELIYKISPKLSFQTNVLPLVIIYGLRFEL